MIGPLATDCIDQYRKHWCWAAVCTEISGIFGGSEPQQSFAYRIQRLHYQNAPSEQETRVPPRDKTNPKGSLPLTSLDGVLTEILGRGGARLTAGQGERTLDALALVGELRAGRPVVLKIEWSATEAHFVLVVGAIRSGDNWMFTVDDPIKGRQAAVSYAGLLHYERPGSPNQQGNWKYSWRGIQP